MSNVLDNKHNAPYVCNGASNHSVNNRASNDYYATDPIAAEWLIKLNPHLSNIWECACGEGHLAKVFDKYGLLGKATDIIDRGYGNGIQDFLEYKGTWGGDIVTNPPYKYAEQFVRKALEVVDENHLVCMFLKINFLEGKSRKILFKEHPPSVVYISSSRMQCGRNGEFKKKNDAVCYCWYVWNPGWKGPGSRIEWFN